MKTCRSSSIIKLCSLKVSDEYIEPELAKYRRDDKTTRNSVEGNEVGNSSAVAVVTEYSSKTYHDK